MDGERLAQLPPMTRDEAVEELKRLYPVSVADPEIAHGMADDVLLRLINDPDVIDAFDAVIRWYA